MFVKHKLGKYSHLKDVTRLMRIYKLSINFKSGGFHHAVIIIGIFLVHVRLSKYTSHFHHVTFVSMETDMRTCWDIPGLKSFVCFFVWSTLLLMVSFTLLITHECHKRVYQARFRWLE